MYPNFNFEILHKDPNSRARLGRLTTPHGSIETPSFIFCGTKAAIKGATIQQIKQEKAQIILANTYHLMLQPGAELVEKMGGLHKFTGWDGPMLTDSGGYQIFSLGHGSVAEEIKGNRSQKRGQTLVKINEKGAAFRSYLDGSKHLLTPEHSIEIQRKLGADLILVLDECTPFHVEKAYTAKSMELSHRWAKRSYAEFDRGNDGRQALYGIVQGGVYEDLRQISAEFCNELPSFGIAVGGSLGASKEQMYKVVAMTMKHIRQDRPVHLLGIGGVEDIWNGIEQGIDTFDCVHPTRLARHGGALVKGAEKDRINIRNTRYKEDPRPIEEACDCYTCQNYSRSYLHHLQKAGELIGLQLLNLHNIRFMTRLLEDVREAIRTNTVKERKAQWLTPKHAA